MTVTTSWEPSTDPGRRRALLEALFGGLDDAVRERLEQRSHGGDLTPDGVAPADGAE